MEENRNILNQSIRQLKQVEGPDVWVAISAELDKQEEQNRDRLSRSIQLLPVKEAPQVWSVVANNLDDRSISPWKYLAIAASVSLLALITYLVVPKTSAEEVTYSTEQVAFFEVGQQISETNDADDLLLSYIKENCVQLATTCQDPEFKELLEAYMELSDTKEALNEALEVAPDQTQVMKYLIRVEKNQTQIGKDMLKKMKSI